MEHTVWLTYGTQKFDEPIVNKRLGQVWLNGFQSREDALKQAVHLKELGLHIYRVMNDSCEILFDGDIPLTGDELQIILSREATKGDSQAC